MFARWFEAGRARVAQVRTARQPAEEPLFDAAFRRRLERLAIRTRQALAWRAIGEHRSPRRSPSREFVDFRLYTPGEDPRYLDWNTYARLGELVTRLGEISSELTVHILVDTSASMNWGDPNKARYAKRLAASLGYLTLWHFDRLIVAPFDTRLGALFGPRRGRAAVRPLFDYLEALPAGGETDLARALGGYVTRWRRRGVLILISDLLSNDGATIGPALEPLLSRGWEVMVLHTLDPQEVEPAYAGDLQLHDVESIVAGRGDGQGLRVVPDDEAVGRYRAGIDAWLAGLEGYCARHRVGYLRVLTTWPFETLVLRFLLEDGFLAPRHARGGGPAGGYGRRGAGLARRGTIAGAADGPAAVPPNANAEAAGVTGVEG
ncbi:MAG: hypothetical protein AVDCRST_MAG88-1589 [uncultured Thermomicrobiales bacterium]|uniref:DUF58 domain-containing protein n=1 Tax=uncultured Thermomicrobiales bacterium TaxID=1645740 RepID=A0A6J4UYM4_9BACT|nr:MAG: hypothetical protein AVDCRST_MAG88-1589 [uncultured Thermomicrobiales bacterium]